MTRHSRAMYPLHLALLAVAALALAGCAAVPPPLSRPIDRANGQPRWLPCMSGDVLCR